MNGVSDRPPDPHRRRPASAARSVPRIGWESDTEVTPVNSTARWPERLKHAATLLRAEGAAVLTVEDGGVATLFTHQIAPETDWADLFGEELLHSAHGSAGPLTAAIAAGRWGEGVAYGIVARIEAQATPLLCILRHHRPFDAIEIAGAHAAAALLAQALDDGRRVASADRILALRAMGRTARNGLATGGPAGLVLARTAADIAASIDADAASIMVVQGEELIVRAAVGLPRNAVGQRQRIGEGIAGWVARSGEPVELRGAVHDARFTGADAGVSDALVLPLRAGGRVVGVLSVKRSGRADMFDALERTLAGELAEELARAVSADQAGVVLAPGTAVDGRSQPLGGPPASRLRVLAVEDHPVLRVGIRAVLEREGMVVTGVPATCAEAVEQVRADRAGGADVALVDLGLPDADGVEVVERLHAAAPTLPIVVFTVDSSPDRVRAAIRAGATGYLPKSIPTAQLTAALRAAAAGLSALAPTEAGALVAHQPAVGPVHETVARSLTPADPTAAPMPAAPPAAPAAPPGPERPVGSVGSAGSVGSVGAARHNPRATTADSGGSHAPAGPLGSPGPAASAGPSGSPQGTGSPESPESTGPTGSPGSVGAIPDRTAMLRLGESLTARELDLLRYLAEGHTNKEIARAMALAEDTVKKGVQTLIAKLGATDRTHAVVLALRSSLIV